LGRYRNSEEPYKNRVLGSYRDMGSDHYLASRAYSKPYRNPRPTRSYSKPPMGRGGRGRLDRNSKPEYFQSPKPEQKYESIVKPEKISSPLLEKNPRYRLENDGNQVDTEHVAKEVEKRLEDRLTEELLEKFGAELEELIKRIEKTSESSEQRIETRQEVEGHVEKDHGQRGDAEIEGLESGGGSQEHGEESKEDSVSLEGGFVVSKPFGLAIPIEADEKKIEDVQTENQEESEVETETKDESTETEDTEGETETESVEDTKAEAESSEEGVAQPEEPVENTEDIEAKDSSEPEETGEVVPEEAIEPEVDTEMLPEEAELYPVEEEPTEIV
jgi:hypothetical protein